MGRVSRGIDRFRPVAAWIEISWGASSGLARRSRVLEAALGVFGRGTPFLLSVLWRLGVPAYAAFCVYR